MCSVAARSPLTIGQAQGRLSGTGERAGGGGERALGMCSVGWVNVFSFGADVSSFRANVSSFWPNVFSFEGNVSTVAGEVSSFWVGRPGWGWGADGRRDSYGSAALRSE